MIGPTDLLHPSPAPHFKTFQVFLIYFPKCPSLMSEFSLYIYIYIYKVQGISGGIVNILGDGSMDYSE